MKLNTKAVNYWKKITSLAVVGSLLFGVVVPQISFASSFPLKKDYLREPLTFQLEKRKSNIYRTDENHRLRKDSGLREGGRFASEAQVLAMAAPYIPVDQFSKVSKEFSKSIKEQIHRDSLSSNQSLSKHIPTEHFPHTSNQLLSQTATQGNNDFPYTSNESLSQRGTESNKDFPSTIQSLANQVSDFVSRVSALHGGTEHDLSGLIVRKRAEHGLNITEEEWRRSEKFDLKPFNQFLSNYLEIYFDKYRVKEFEEMTTEELKEGKKPLTGEEKEMIREIELEFEEQANNAFRYVGVTRVKVGLWEGPGMVESEDAWIIAPVFITDRSETLDSKYVHYQRVRNETGKSFIHRGLIKQWLEIKKKYGEESMMESVKVYVVRELGAQALMDMQRAIPLEVVTKQKDLREGFDLAHLVVQGGSIEALRLMLGYLDIGFTSNSGSERNYTLRWAEDRWHKYATLSLAIMENWSLDHKGLMELGKRVANDIRLGDFKDYVYVRDLVDGMFDSESMIPTNPLGLFGEFLRELYQNVKEGKNGVGDYAKALNDIFNLIKRNQEFYMQYKELMEKALVLLNKQGKSWKEIGLHKIIPIPTDQDSLKPLIELIEKLEKGNDNRQGIIKVVGTILVVISSVLAGQEVLANGLVPAITNGLSFIDLVPLITGGAGFHLLNGNLNKYQNNPKNNSSDEDDPFIEKTAQILGDSELVKGLFSFYQKVMGKIEDPGIRFLANIKDLKENPSKLNELKSFAEEAARVALSQDSSGEGVASTNDPSPFDLTQGKQDSLAEGTRPYEFVIVTDENKLLSKEEVIAFLKEYQVPTDHVRVILHPLKDEMFDLKSLVDNPKNKLTGDGYALRVIDNIYWLILKELKKNTSIINGLELLELNLKGKKSVDRAA